MKFSKTLLTTLILGTSLTLTQTYAVATPSAKQEQTMQNQQINSAKALINTFTNGDVATAKQLLHGKNLANFANYFNGDNYIQHNSQIAEHWDVIETIAEPSTWQNQNGKF